MRRIIIEIDETNLPSHTEEQFVEFVETSVGYGSGISMKNPLMDECFQPESVEIE